MISRLLFWVGGAALLAYPVLAWLGLRHGTPVSTAILLMILAAFRLPWFQRHKSPGVLLWIAAIPFSVATLTALSGNPAFLLWAPALTSYCLLFFFGRSLWVGIPVAESFARIKHPVLGPAAIAYCRKATQAWCLFFAFNGTVASYTAWHGDRSLWALYNGLIFYGLLALMAGGEYLVRRRVQPIHAI
jgi:uncharacterized membrane protein